MLRLSRFLKPYTPLIAAAIALLFVQAMSDLALPNYMARIVNVGIQQGGVEDAAPQAIRASQMERLTLFLTGDEQAAVLDAYTRVDSASAQYEALLGTYPALADGPIYVLNEGLSADAVERLNPVMGRALLAVSGIQQAMEDPEAAGAGAFAEGFDFSQLPPGTDVFALLGIMPDAQRAELLSRMDEAFDAMGESLIVQSAVIAVQDEYEALGMSTSRLQNRYILNTGAVMLALSLLSGAAAVAVGYFAARTAAGLARDVRHDLFRTVENFSGVEFDQFSTASLITRSTNDVTQVQMIVMMLLRMVAYAPLMGVGAVILAIGKSPSMSWLLALAVLVLIGFVGLMFAIAMPRFRIMQALIDRLNLVTREHLSGMMVIRAFNTQAFEEARFDRANRDLTDTMMFISRIMALMMPFMMLLMNGLSVLIIWLGARQIAASNMQVGDMMAFIQYAMHVVMSFLVLSMMFIFLPRAAVSAGRIVEVLDTQPSIRDPEQPRAFNGSFAGTVTFDNVSFRYPGAEEDVLHDISFTAQPGQTTAFIGSTGSGKSTVVNLIPRFYDVTAGAIRIDGVDVRDVSQHDLREKIGYIPQRGILFSGTIGSNLLYADEHAGAQTIQTAVEVAQAAEFVYARPEGLDAEISQGGTNVSGGQRQRLSIARALVKQPPIYIFDDSFSALDFKTDAALRRELKRHTGDSTVLIVAQRIATIKNAEQIIVLDQGRVVGRGTHEALMDTCETYREIALSQLSLEELS